MGEQKIKIKGTPGVGDFMMGLNIAHNSLVRYGKKTEVEFHWQHGPDYQHHFEDPETIIERLEYIHRFYEYNGLVKVSHVFNSTDTYVMANTVVGGPDPRHVHGCNNWHFQDKFNLPCIEDKVVLWRPTFNAELPRKWKRLLSEPEWCEIITLLKANGFDVVELGYRTPVSEAMYHINTCKFIVCYDGIWHYVAKNFMKPMLVISRSGITKTHTPHALMLSEKKREAIRFIKYIHFPRNTRWGETDGVQFLQHRADKYKQLHFQWLDKCKSIERS